MHHGIREYLQDTTGQTQLEKWTMGPTAWLLYNDDNNDDDDDKVGQTNAELHKFRLQSL
jgi:hypothetical protein